MTPQYCYVMTDGTNNGARTTATTFTSRQTGAFSDLGGVGFYYASIDSAIDSNTLVDGDEIICANTHDVDYGVAAPSVFPANITCYSVLYTDLETYQSGAIERATVSNNDIPLTSAYDKKVTFKGISFYADDDIHFNSAGNSTVEISDGILNIEGVGSAEKISSTQDAGLLLLNNVDVEFQGGDQGFKLGGGSKLQMIGGSIDYNGTVPIKILEASGSGGSTLILDNVDASTITSGYILPTLTPAADAVNVTLKRCKKNSNLLLVNGDLASNLQQVDAWSVDNGDGYHYFEHHRFQGKIEESITIKRTNGATYDGTNGFTAKVLPNSNVVEFTCPLSYKLKTPKLDLSGASGATLTVHIHLQDSAGTPVSLTTKNCRIKAVYPDSTDTALGKTVYSNPTEDILSAGSALDIQGTPTFTGTGVSGTVKEHYIALTIPQNTGAGMDEAICELWLELSVNLAATTEMFVCPDPTVT